jgi:hypothetical protein
MKASKWVAVLSTCAIGGVAAFTFSGCDFSPGASSAASSADESPSALSAVREKDAAWRPTHSEVGIIRVGQRKTGDYLHNFCVNLDGNILACCGGPREEASYSEPSEIKVFSPAGKCLQSWKMETQPQAICVHRDGTIYVGGGGRIFRLNQEGKVMAAADSPVGSHQTKLSDTVLNELKSQGRDSQQQIALYKRSLEQRKKAITGIAVTDRDLFVVCPSPSDFSYTVYRFDHDLKNPKLIVEGLHGCCGQMDIQAGEDKLWVPHNARHRVECRDRDGKQLSAFGKTDRKAAEGFGGCCEPKNVRVAGSGIFTAESGPPVVIKHFTQEGKFLGVVAIPTFPTSCVRVTVDRSPDGKRWYILDTTEDAIHVFEAKGTESSS